MGPFYERKLATAKAKSLNESAIKPNPPLSKWIPAKAVKFNRNGSVSIRKTASNSASHKVLGYSIPKRKKRNPALVKYAYFKTKKGAKDYVLTAKEKGITGLRIKMDRNDGYIVWGK